MRHTSATDSLVVEGCSRRMGIVAGEQPARAV